MRHEKKCVSVGLYRAAGTMGASEPFVVTCPGKDTVLMEDDRVYYIGTNSLEYCPEKPKDQFLRVPDGFPWNQLALWSNKSTWLFPLSAISKKGIRCSTVSRHVGKTTKAEEVEGRHTKQPLKEFYFPLLYPLLLTFCLNKMSETPRLQLEHLKVVRGKRKNPILEKADIGRPRSVAITGEWMNAWMRMHVLMSGVFLFLWSDDGVFLLCGILKWILVIELAHR